MLWSRISRACSSVRLGVAPRLQSRYTTSWNSYVDKCPDPTVDTGCTYCTPDPALLPLNENPLPPAPFHDKHLVICTGTSDWPSKIDLVPESLASVIRQGRMTLMKNPVLVTNCDLPSRDPKAPAVLLFPDNLLFESVSPELIPELFENYVNSSAGSTPKSSSRLSAPIPAPPIFLICGHTQRDARCGAVAPLLVDEFKQVLQSSNRPDIQVSICSHIGGHAFAGNVVYHPGGSVPSTLPSVWYGGVFPSHVQGIVSETVEQGRIIRQLLRGMGPSSVVVDPRKSWTGNGISFRSK